MVQLEVCVDSIESARNAIEGGASRLEVCSALSEGGLTPTLGLIKMIKTIARGKPIYAMIRARGGNFIYSAEEVDVMLYDLKYLKDLGVDGFVFGALTQDYQVDTCICQQIVKAANPLPVTFHRAFDMVSDPFKSLELIINLSFKRILTSGQKQSAHEGMDLIASLVKKFGDRIIIMPGAGVTHENISKIIDFTGAREIHASAKTRKILISDSTNQINTGYTEDTNFVTCTNLVSQMKLKLKR
ncbi:copper homeostasis protein cutC homolog [Prorops nasuta]|uniref:copper homeostasis protein cutC homolog n=1 Tax=Prorops nasuta TaxID=863751 RepID=UPI0034CDB14B